MRDKNLVLNSEFSVAERQRVRFTSGNLLYSATEDAFLLTERQFDILTDHAGNTTPSHERRFQQDCIDLLCYGATGIDNNQAGYQPWYISTDDTDYFAKNTAKTSADHGYPFSATHDGLYRILTANEWRYLLLERDGERFAKATIHGVPGLLIVPDNRASGLKQVNNTLAVFTSNVIGEDFENIYERAGYVFLPCGGTRIETTVSNTRNNDAMGCYLSSTSYGAGRCCSLTFACGKGNNNVKISHTRKSMGQSIRLVSDIC